MCFRIDGLTIFLHCWLWVKEPTPMYSDQIFSVSEVLSNKILSINLWPAQRSVYLWAALKDSWWWPVFSNTPTHSHSSTLTQMTQMSKLEIPLLKWPYWNRWRWRNRVLTQLLGKWSRITWNFTDNGFGTTRLKPPNVLMALNSYILS